MLNPWLLKYFNAPTTWQKPNRTKKQQRGLHIKSTVSSIFLHCYKWFEYFEYCSVLWMSRCNYNSLHDAWLQIHMRTGEKKTLVHNVWTSIWKETNIRYKQSNMTQTWKQCVAIKTWSIFSQIFTKKTPHNSPVKTKYGVSLVNQASGWYSATVPVIICVISCNIGPRYNDTQLYSHHIKNASNALVLSPGAPFTNIF